MTTAIPSICFACRHLDRTTVSRPNVPTSCKAYPDGIPERYLIRGNPHTDPDPTGADGGITFGLSIGKQRVLDGYLAFWFEADDRGDPEVSGRAPDEVDM